MGHWRTLFISLLCLHSIDSLLHSPARRGLSSPRHAHSRQLTRPLHGWWYRKRSHNWQRHPSSFSRAGDVISREWFLFAYLLVHLLRCWQLLMSRNDKQIEKRCSSRATHSKRTDRNRMRLDEEDEKNVKRSFYHVQQPSQLICIQCAQCKKDVWQCQREAADDEERAAKRRKICDLYPFRWLVIISNGRWWLLEIHKYINIYSWKATGSEREREKGNPQATLLARVSNTHTRRHRWDKKAAGDG